MTLPTPVVRVLGPDRFELLRPYVYQWAAPDFDGRRARLAIPMGFVFDYASVPRPVHAFIGRLDLGLVAPLMHDWLYAFGGRLPVGSHEWLIGDTWQQVGEPWTRRDADRLFGRHMREEGVARWRRRSAYRAVRLFGSRAWGGRAGTPPPGFET
jgi:hypothetical protein